MKSAENPQVLSLDVSLISLVVGLSWFYRLPVREGRMAFETWDSSCFDFPGVGLQVLDLRFIPF